MKVSITEAKSRRTSLVRRAEAGEEVVLTRHGQAAVRLTPIVAGVDRTSRMEALERLSREAAAKALPGPDAARSQDFLYDDDGLPK